MLPFAFRLSPLGTELVPVGLKRYGGTPPVTAIVWAYAERTLPGGNAVVTMASGPLTVTLKFCVALLGVGVLVSVTRATNMNDQVAVVIPEITPELEFSASPEGKPPDAMLQT